MAEHNDAEAIAENPDSNHSVPVEPTLGVAAVNGGGGDALVSVESVDKDKPNDPKLTEDGGREDMFVDCPDDIETSESQTTSEDKDDVQQDTRLEDFQSRPSAQVEDLIAETALLHRKVEETAAEKQRFVQLYEEEQAMLTEIADRVLASIPTAINQGGRFLDDSVGVGNKFSHVERSISLVIEKYNQFVSGIEKLKSCLTNLTPDISMVDEVGIFFVAHDKLLELRGKETNLDGKLSHFENENVKLVEQLDKNKAVIENANAEIEKLRAELEQEKTKYSNTKEKLSLAVTKGKALVQHRDSLKQALADKTIEVEKCLIQLQEKSTALDSAEESKELLLKSETMAAQLQESLVLKDALLQKCEEIISNATETEEIESLDLLEKLRWIANEKNALKGLNVQIQKLSDALSPVSFPENICSDDMETRVSWLAQSFSIYKEEVAKLQNEIIEAREASSTLIDRLVASVLAETLESSYLQEELEDLKRKYEDILEKERHIIVERDEIVNMLLSASGMRFDTMEKVNISQADVFKIIGKIKEESETSSESSHGQAEIFERLQLLLYIRSQDVALYEHLLEEAMIDRSENEQMSEKLVAVTEELCVVKDEKISLEAELLKSADKAALVREKLSMAVKKGKGLFQERENLKRVLDEKSTEIERLTGELQEQTSASNDLRDQIKKLVADMDCIPRLEDELAATKEQRNQLEYFLVESNSMLQKVIESIDSIDLPDGLVFKEPAEKVKWLSDYLSECQTVKTEAQQELEKLKDESSTLASKLVEAETSTKSIDDALIVAKNSISQILNEKRELEFAKVQMEQELQKALQDVTLQKSKFAEVAVAVKSFEDALSVAEDNISSLTNEKEDALHSKAAAEQELEKLKDENLIHVSRIAEADKTIQSLEEAFSQAQKSFSLLTNEKEDALHGKAAVEQEFQKLKEENLVHVSRIAEADKAIQSLEEVLSQAQKSFSFFAEENNKREIGRSDLEDEFNKLKAEADSQASKLAEAAVTIKSLEDAVLGAENRISDLVKENEMAALEISSLNSKLQACLQELDESHGRIANSSLDLASYVTRIQKLQKDVTVSSLLKQSFENKIEDVQRVDILLKEIRDCFSDMIGSDLLHNRPFMMLRMIVKDGNCQRRGECCR